MINIGYDSDGQVVITILSTAEGKPIKTDLQMTPENALKIAAGITQAAAEARKVNDERDSPNFN